jgi:hypothetical protein
LVDSGQQRGDSPALGVDFTGFYRHALGRSLQCQLELSVTFLAKQRGRSQPSQTFSALRGCQRSVEIRQVVTKRLAARRTGRREAVAQVKVQQSRRGAVAERWEPETFDLLDQRTEMRPRDR